MDIHAVITMDTVFRPGPPEPPKAVHVDCVTKKEAMIAVVRFTPSGTNYAPILAFYIQYNTSFTPDHWTTAAKVGEGAKETKVDVQMSPYVNYTFRVLAYNRMGMSAPSLSTPETCTTIAAKPSSNPINVRVRGTTPTNLVITWTVRDIFMPHLGGAYCFRRVRSQRKSSCPFATEVS